MPDNHDACPCAAVEELKKIVEQHDKRLQEHQERLADGNTSFALIRRDVAGLISSVDRLTNVIDDFKGKPAKHWEDAVKQVITFVIGAALAYIALRLGLQP